MFETNEDYFIKVIGRLPDEWCPDPHIVLRDYVKYEVKRGAYWPDGYVELKKRQENWPEDQRDWPHELNIEFLEQFPLSDGTYSWWPIIQVVPKEGSRLKTILGVAWVAYCVV